ncbi:MAG: 16S rRNA (cytidine(1402)-2'-O)-methyltransferase [Deltaproteobacteria bacterium]|jgi:16S rRNA (cytidine1402-2'-O)-methyltransferase|nr:16S rRNA (cytidine(1402)-2'-O)-methyltransferase [Deltaproteobacteria bacterium]
MNDPDTNIVERNPTQGALYVVSTPIGNLEDITLRALKILKRVDVIAAENVAHTKRLCERHGTKTRVTSYHQHNQSTKTQQLIQKLRSGMDLALVTDAGTPGISDPGVYLVNRAVAEGIRVIPIPGPSAVVAALSISGLPTARFVFIGFLSNKSGRRKRELERLSSETRTMVFFEAPHRIKEMLADLKAIFGERQMVMLREMTKVFEDVQRGTPGHILASLTPETIKGEFTLVVAGTDAKETSKGLSQEALNRIEELIREKRLSIKDIATLIAKEEGLAYRQVYKECLDRKGEAEGPSGVESIRKLKVRNSLGLHARSAAKIVELGKEYKSQLFLRKDGEEVDGSSILSILTLSCPKGTEMEARIVGDDSERFMEKLNELFEGKFGERV